MKTKISITILVLTVLLKLNAQQDMMISQYMFNGIFLNPAYSGSHEHIEATALYRQQWVSFEGAPVSQIVSFDAPVQKKNFGWGGILTNDKIGVSYKTDLYGNYAYHLKVSEKGKISLGVRAGFSYYRANLTQLTVWDANDISFTNNIKNKFLPNAGAGIYYYTDKMYAGISSPSLINYEPKTFLNASGMSDDLPHLKRHIYLNAGYVFQLSENLHLKPSVLVKYVQNAPVQADLNANLFINKFYCVGVSYRSKDGIVGMLEYQHQGVWRFGYSYDFALTKIRNYTFGSHELMISYMFKKKEHTKIKSPRFF